MLRPPSRLSPRVPLACRLRPALRLCLALAVVMLPLHSALAATHTLTTTGSSTWSTATWTGGAPTSASASSGVVIGGNITVAGTETRTLFLQAIQTSGTAVAINGSIGATSAGASTINIVSNGTTTTATSAFTLAGAIGGAVGTGSTI